MKQKLVIKVGTSILSNGDVLALERIENLCAFIARLQEKYSVILVSSGAVASGYTKLRLDKNIIENRQALASIGQPLIIETYRNFLESHGILCAQFLLVRNNFDSRTYTDYVRNAIEILLSKGVLPIINENDAVTIDGLLVGDIGDNDRLGAYAAHYLDAPMLVILSDVYGYFSSNPLESSDAKLIKFIKAIDSKHFSAQKSAGSEFGTGGIVTKLIAADFLLQRKRKMFLCSGFDLRPSYEFLLEGKHTQGTLFSCDKGVEI